MDSEAKKLYKTYQALPRAERQILQVLSVIFEPLRQGKFQTILKNLAWCEEIEDKGNKKKTHHKKKTVALLQLPTLKGGPLLSLLMVKPLREKLLKLNLLTYEKGYLQCHLKIVELLTRETQDNDTYHSIVEATRKQLPLMPKESQSYQYDYFFRDRPYYVQAQMRFAIFNGDKKAILEINQFESYRLRRLSFDNRVGSLEIICKRLLDSDEKLFLEIPVAIKFMLVASSAQSHYYHFSTDWTMEQLGKLLPTVIGEEESAALLLAELYILQGKLVGAEALLAKGQSSNALALKGWVAMLKGENEQALLLYDESIKSIRKETRKRNVFVPDLAGIFHLIVLLASQDKAYYKQAQLLIKYQIKDDHTFFSSTLTQLQDSLDLHQGKVHLDTVSYLGRQSSSTVPYCHLLHALQHLWINKEIDPVFISQLFHYHQVAVKSGYHWFAWQVEQVLLKLNQQSPLVAISKALKKIKPLELKGYRDLTELIAIREPWEIALDALDEVTLSGGTSNNSIENGSNESRMSWRLYEYDSLVPDPYEQRLSKNGKWTKGRKVSLKKLYEERGDYDYLTEQDQQICNQIMEYSYYEYGYQRTTFEMEPYKSLLATIGHPLIFLGDNVSTPVELVKSEPCLVIKEVGKGKNLRLQLYPYSTEKLAIHIESHQKISLVEYKLQHQQIAEILGKKGITVPKKAKKQVVDRMTTLAPLLTIHSDIAGANSDIKKVKAKQILHVHLQPIDAGLKFSAYIQPFKTPQPLFHPGEGGATVFAEVDNQQVQTHRNITAERKIISQLLQRCPALYQNSQYEWLLDDPELALETLLQLQEFQLASPKTIHLEWPQGKKITLNNAAEVSQMSVKIGKSQDWFSVSGQLQISDNKVLEMRQLMDLLAQSSGRFIPLGENQFLALTEELRSRLDAIQAYTSDQGKFHALAIPALDELTEGMQVKASKPWKDQLKRLQDSRELKFQVPSTLQAELRDYQQEGFQWLARLAHWGAGACLADDMGLGKTMQALALILTRCKQGPTLILAPTSVCTNWETEAFRFAPTLNIKRFGMGDRQKMLDHTGAFDLIICSYGLLQSESERLGKVQWHTVVADEAQAIKNYQAKRTKAAMQLQADFRIITTGTPIENHLGELWSLYHFINPGLLGSLEAFNHRYATPIERDNNHQARQQLKNLISPFILRRLKSDVLTELPSRTEITLTVELSKEELALYEAMRQQAVENVADVENAGQKRMKILAEIMRLRRVCCNPRLVMPDSPIASSKLEAFKEIVDELLANNHKALVFSQFVGHLALIREYLDEQDIEYQYLDGSTPVKKRQQAVTNFQAGEGDLFLISLKAGGSGLNLTAADYVIHLDPWWNPAVEDQASDRAHRIGQKRPVTIYRLVAKNTIEEKIVGLHHQKRDLADSLLEGTEMSGKLSVDDILTLLKES